MARRNLQGLTQIQAAAQACVTQSTVSLSIKSGKCRTLDDGSIDPAEVDRVWPPELRRNAAAQVVAGASAGRPPVLLALGGANAKEALAGLEPGGRVVGITKGQFGLADLLSAALDRTGAADVLVSCWRVGADAAEALRADARVRSLRLVIDYGFGKVEPDVAVRVINAWGVESIRLARTHAKFFVVRGNGWNICCRTSMNLNKNPRFEQFDVDDDAEVCALFERFAVQVTESLPPGLGAGWEDVRARLEAGLDGRNDGDRLIESEREARDEHVLITTAAQARDVRARRETDEPDFYMERARKMKADADLAETKAAQARVELVPAAQVERDAYEAARITRDRVMTVSARVTAIMRAAGTDAEARRLMDEELRSALRSAADEIAAGVSAAGETDAEDP